MIITDRQGLRHLRVNSRISIEMTKNKTYVATYRPYNTDLRDHYRGGYYFFFGEVFTPFFLKKNKKKIKKFYYYFVLIFYFFFVFLKQNKKRSPFPKFYV